MCFNHSKNKRYFCPIHNTRNLQSVKFRFSMLCVLIKNIKKKTLGLSRKIFLLKDT